MGVVGSLGIAGKPGNGNNPGFGISMWFWNVGNVG